MKQLTKETKFIIIATPLVLGLLGFMFFSGGEEEVSPENQITEEQKVQKNLLSKLDDGEEEDDIDQVLNKDNRHRVYNDEQHKFSVNSEDQFSEAGIWDDAYSKPSSKKEVEEDNSNEETQVSTQSEKPKIVYVERKSSSKTKNQSNTQSSNQITSQQSITTQPEIRRKTSINSSYNGVQNTKSNEFIHAVIHNKQEVHAGGEVKIRTTEESIINNLIIPANTYMSGVSSFQNDRILITIKSFELHGGKIIYTNLIVYDKGVKGVYIPGGVNQEIATDAASNTISQSSSTLNIPIIGSITTNGGQKKVNDKSVILTEGYKILLKQEVEKD